MRSAFHQLWPRYSGTLTPTAPTAIRLWETFTYQMRWEAKRKIRVAFPKNVPIHLNMADCCVDRDAYRFNMFNISCQSHIDLELDELTFCQIYINYIY